MPRPVNSGFTHTKSSYPHMKERARAGYHPGEGKLRREGRAPNPEQTALPQGELAETQRLPSGGPSRADAAALRAGSLGSPTRGLKQTPQPPWPRLPHLLRGKQWSLPVP